MTQKALTNVTKQLVGNPTDSKKRSDGPGRVITHPIVIKIPAIPFPTVTRWFRVWRPFCVCFLLGERVGGSVYPQGSFQSTPDGHALSIWREKQRKLANIEQISFIVAEWCSTEWLERKNNFFLASEAHSLAQLPIEPEIEQLYQNLDCPRNQL